MGDDPRGERAVRIVVHRDADRDGPFGHGNDPPCSADGGLVRSDSLLVDFDAHRER